MNSDAESILLVDDDPAFTGVLTRALRRRGFAVTAASDAAEAIAAMRIQSYHRAVVDLKLARESGLHLIPRLKTLDNHLRIVVLTGYSSIATAVQAIKLGATHYLCKPASTEQLLAAFNAAQGDPNTAIHAQPPSVERLEWEHIQGILAAHRGNISATARALGMHRRTLQRKLQKRPVRK